ncbi:gene transfer agent family protein [Tropicimonas marinistellae]|uniref:gene transfer agent family protein n=1 Tax=Tropicimonas marinistellae TaxID=1739787 RepID=UPI00082D6100|nr:gene transfer agent family protein [Tropicimonas marinistellae]
MANPWTGEVSLTLDGVPYQCKLTLGALAELEDTLSEGSLIDLVERFEAGRFSARDVLALIVAGLRGGGWTGRTEDLRTTEIGDGPAEAAKVAAQLLGRAFSLPDSAR